MGIERNFRSINDKKRCKKSINAVLRRFKWVITDSSVHMIINKVILQKFILSIGDFLTHQNVMSYYKYYDNSQWLRYNDLVDIQNNNLAETIQTTYRDVYLYRNLYDFHRINISSIRTIKELSRLPVITKDMIQRSYPKNCTRRTGLKIHEFFTSGSTGKPFVVTVDNDSLSRARALMILRAKFSGWEIGDPFLQTGMTLNRGVIKYIKDKLFGAAYVSAFNLSNRVLDEYLSMIDNKNLEFLMGYPASIYYLAQRAEEVGFARKMKGIVTWGDNLYNNYRNRIQEQFGCRVTDTYGCGEGIQVAAQCEYGNYHIFMPHVVVEITDDRGEPVPDGELGNILLTRLDPGAMPLIRYSVGDIGRKPLQRTECACGRGFEIMSSIEGRDTDVVVTPNGNRLIVHFFTGIFEYYQSIDTFKVIQEDRDLIRILIVPGKDFHNGVLLNLKQEILSKGDMDLHIQFEIVDEIKCEASNKRRFVVSRLKNE